MLSLQYVSLLVNAFLYSSADLLNNKNINNDTIYRALTLSKIDYSKHTTYITHTHIEQGMYKYVQKAEEEYV